jgi:hypothetical protein
MTLSADQRAVVATWSPETRQRFEHLAGELEFIRGLQLGDAELAAFVQVSREVAVEGRHA